MDNSQLNPEDQERVNRYLSSGIHSVERKPLRPWILLGGIWVIMMIFSAISYVIAVNQGAV